MPNKFHNDLSKHEEDYLKALFLLSIESDTGTAGTNALASYLNVSPASVNGMLKKLKQKGLVQYEKYSKPSLTKAGSAIAISLIRKHRLWETFLYEKMNFSWDEVHDVAEQLEHIRSEKLIRELDAFLGHPEVDPHGDAIPDASGKFKPVAKKTLAGMSEGARCRIVAVKDSSVAFLKYVTKLGLELSSEILVAEVQDFDESVSITIDDRTVNVSRKFAENVFVVELQKK